MKNMQVAENNTRYRLNNGRNITARLASHVAQTACEVVFINGRSDVRLVARQYPGLSPAEVFEITVRVMEEAVRVGAYVLSTAPAPVRREAATLIEDMRSERSCVA